MNTTDPIPTTLFQPGHVVQLKSGGPRMTVSRTEGGRVTCAWFYGGSFSFNHFPPEMLMLAPAESTAPPARTCPCCNGPHPFDICVDDSQWAKVVKGYGSSDLCINCVLFRFAAAGNHFTAMLRGGGFTTERLSFVP